MAVEVYEELTNYKFYLYGDYKAQSIPVKFDDGFNVAQSGANICIRKNIHDNREKIIDDLIYAGAKSGGLHDIQLMKFNRS